tara:strand:+ start:1518 stop:2420 length:903 start_codon:yes stop_codon:yes gene_type:complete
MKIVIIGSGTQGKKRKKLIKKKLFYSFVDNKKKNLDFKKIEDVPIDKFDTAFICIPDKEKEKVIQYLLKNKKNILVEKPLLLKKNNFNFLQNKINKKKIFFYTAYNHRFEPNIIRVKNFIKKNFLGKIYYCKLFYGNGTSNLVKNSPWKDKNNGVISDLFPHMIDMLIFWFGPRIINSKLMLKNKFENKSSDYASAIIKYKNFFSIIEGSYCMWKNSFTCEIVGEKGSIHMNDFCKWGTSLLEIRKRVLPSGRPKIKKYIEKKPDPTWLKEHNFFLNCINKKTKVDLHRDHLISKIINEL